jgi:hypothetical protein
LAEERHSLDFWTSPFGSIALNLAASLLWDGGKALVSRARAAGSDGQFLKQLSWAVLEKTQVPLRTSDLQRWLADEDFWALLGQTSGDEAARAQVVEKLHQDFCDGCTADDASAVLAILLVELARGDGDLSHKLHEARLQHRFDVLEHSLGYTFEETLSATLIVDGKVTDGFERVEHSLDEIRDRLGVVVGGLEAELLRIRALASEGVLLREAAVQLQVIAYQERGMQ